MSKEREALKLALEALEYFSDTSNTMAGKAHAEDAIAAIKEALAQPERKPLTDEQILSIIVSIGPEYHSIELARAIEAAHGIKGDA